MYEYEENDNIYDQDYLNALDRIEDFVENNFTDGRLVSEMNMSEVFNSTKIEGNRLSREQMEHFLEDDVTVRGISLRDFVQVRNYSDALDALKRDMFAGAELTEEFICGIHYMITQGELAEAGQYRNDFVHIRTTNTVPPEPALVPILMKELVDRYNVAMQDPERHPFEIICEFKRNFERIHPFFDGNGRTGRLLMNILFLNNGYPCISIPAELRPEYFDSLENNTFCAFAAERMLESIEKIQLEWDRKDKEDHDHD